MKRKILFSCLLFLLILIPFNVAAASNATLSLSCTGSVKKNATVTCKVKANITSGTIKSISGTANGNSTYFVTTTNFNNTEPTGFTGSSVDVATFSLTTKTTAGTAEILIDNLVVEDVDDDPVTLTSTNIRTSITVLDDEKNLTNILVDGTSVSSFNPITKSYTFSVDKDKVAISVLKPASVKSVTGTGTKNLTCGSNKINLVVTAQDDSTNTYTLNITRNCTNDVTLKDLTVSSGTLSPAFSNAVKKYTVTVTNDIDKITIAATKNDEKQTISGTVTNKALNPGENSFAIIVTAENGSKDTYTIVVTREQLTGDLPVASISSLILSSGKISFNPYVYEYRTRVLYDVTNITVNAISGTETGIVTIVGGNNLIVGENIITVTIKDGTETKDYKIIVTRLEEGVPLGDNANIKNITIKGYTLNFNPDVIAYKLKIGKETELDISILLEEADYADYIITGNKNLKDGSVITITVTSIDGTTKVYKITIDKSNDNLILFASIGAVLIAIVLIVVLVIKSKKDPDKVKTTKVKAKKENTKENKKEEEKEKDKEKDKEKEQIVEVKSDIPLKDEKLVLETKIEEPVVKAEIKAPEEIKEKITVQKIDEVESLDDEPVKKSAEKIIEDNPLEMPEKSTDIETKICSICGHRVAVSSKTCPYCKRTW